MSSEVDICNLALSHLGDEAGIAAITPPDGSIQSAHCGRFYPIARGLLLEMHPWTFAVTRETVAEVENPAPDDWSYAYALPTRCIRPLSALYPGVPERVFGSETDASSHPYVVETDSDGNLVLFTNVETATLRYIRSVSDTAKFTPGFVASLARLLAAYLAGPILKGETGMAVAKAQMQIFAVEFGRAAASNSNIGKRSGYQTYQPAWLAGRGVPTVQPAPISYTGT